jgi:adenine-specific DNA-methyltransferase
LLLAKRLLNDRGVLIIAIDDNENHHLQMLLEQCFPDREMTTVVVVHNPRGNISNNFSYVHEYAHFMIHRGEKAVARIPKANATPRKLRRWGHNSTRKARPTMFYPILVRNTEIVGFGGIPQETYHPKKNVAKDDGITEIWPIDQDGVERRWNFGLDTIPEELGRLVVRTVDGEADVFLTEEKSVPKTVWSGGLYDAGKYGASLVGALIRTDFPFPKSLYTVRDCLSAVTANRDDALILDFFAGSGTTLHATVLLNNETGGNRRCILVTNNEVNEKKEKALAVKGHCPGDPEFERFGLAESVTWPRCKASILGHRQDGPH